MKLIVGIIVGTLSVNAIWYLGTAAEVLGGKW